MNAISLRKVQESDLAIFFEHQHDPDSVLMVDFPPRDYDDFSVHWATALGDETVVLKTILMGNEVAGNIVSWEQNGIRNVGYWLGKKHWGQGIATRALAQFVELILDRPLYAHVAENNVGSIRVLQKCGFVVHGQTAYESINGKPRMEFIMKLDQK